MVLLWSLGFTVGLAVAAFASRRGVSAALAASERSNISPTLIGLTVLAVGTDLPEITNSIAAALGGRGDIGVGDAVGSAFTQVTLVLGLLCLAGRAISADRSTVLMSGGLATAALFGVALIVGDGTIARWEGLVLVLSWVAAIGDLFGSTLLDSTLAVGIGPALRAVDVSSGAVATCLIAALATVAATTIAASKPVHGRSTAPLLIMVYAAAVAAVLIANG